MIAIHPPFTMQEADRGPDISQSLDDLLDEIESISRDALSLKGETAGPSASVSGETGEGLVKFVVLHRAFVFFWKV